MQICYDGLMIRLLSGEVALIENAAVVLSCGGVGYLVHTTPQVAAQLTVGTETLLHTHLAVRETALDLYGFPSAQSLALFELLLSVSGIGRNLHSIPYLSQPSPHFFPQSEKETPRNSTNMRGLVKKQQKKLCSSSATKLPSSISRELIPH